MKIPRLDRLAQLQRRYHRSHQWRLSQCGLFILHSYSNMTPASLSHWDDVGFILNGRRIMVWWQHPRHVSANALEEMAWQEVGNGPDDNWLFEGGTRNYKRVGTSRKKLVSYTSRTPSLEERQHYDCVFQRLCVEREYV